MLYLTKLIQFVLYFVHVFLLNNKKNHLLIIAVASSNSVCDYFFYFFYYNQPILSLQYNIFKQ